MPEPDALPSAVIVTGGKQYRVIPGTRLLVDRLAAEAGSDMQLDRLLMVADGDDFKVGAALEGASVLARVVEHRRGPKIAVLRYKSKKRVRVHRGARADLTLLEIVEVAGRRLPVPEKEAVAEKPRRGRLRRRTAATEAEAVAEEPEQATAVAEAEPEAEEETPARPRRTRARKADATPAAAEEKDDGA